MTEALNDLADRQGGVLLREQILASGLTAPGFRRRRIRASWRRLRRSTYVDAAVADFLTTDEARSHALAAAAALLRLDDRPAVSFESAALLWGLHTLGLRSRHEVQLTRPRRSKGTLCYPGVTVHHAALPETHLSERHGVRVTSPARTVTDIARVRPFRAGLVAADSALRSGLCTAADLLAVAADCTRWPGIRRARAVAEFADARSESPLESISRAAFHEHDVPPPALQEWITPYDRVDFLWPKQRVIGEADGMGKYTAPEALRREKERQEILERLGYRIVRWTWDDVFRRPDAVADWVRAALRR